MFIQLTEYINNILKLKVQRSCVTRRANSKGNKQNWSFLRRMKTVNLKSLGVQRFIPNLIIVSYI